MSKLDELIQQLCPDGVDSLTIENVCIKITSGGTPNTSRNDYYEGDIPWLRTQEVDWNDITDTGVKITNQGLENSSAKWIEKNCVIVAMYGATAAKVAINKIPLTTNQACCNLCVDQNKANYRYVYHWLCNKYEEIKALGQGSQSNINAKIIRGIPIAVPPLPIQNEIVRILDNFTELIEELTEELTARKKQYEYYRDQLLTFAEDDKQVRWMYLGDIAKFTYGFTDKAKEQGSARFIRITDIGDNGCLKPDNAKYVDISQENEKYCLMGGDLLVARTGATYGKTLYVSTDEPAIYASFLIKIELDNTKIINRYYWHFTKSSYYWDQANKLVSAGGQPQFNSNVLCRVKLAVPPLAEQERIVSILDRFDSLCNDITAGLPAEIEARRKQYEYYRDKLLTFKELGA